MKPDLYTKAVLTVIALMLTVIACKTVVSPETTASAQGPFAGVQYSYFGGDDWFFDTRSGELWGYSGGPNPAFKGQVIRKSKLTKLGQPLAVEIGR